jgi:hypothetical protein
MVDPAWNETASQLAKQSTVTLNSSGVGTIEFDTDNANQRWEVTNVVVSTNQAATATTIPVASLGLNADFLGNLATSNQRGSTWSANQDQWSGGTIDVGHTDSFAVTFTPAPGASGTPLAGVLATAVVTGTKYTRRS